MVYCLIEGEISPQLIHMAFTFLGGTGRGAIDTAKKWLNRPNLNSSWTSRASCQNLLAHQDYSLKLLIFFCICNLYRIYIYAAVPFLFRPSLVGLWLL